MIHPFDDEEFREFDLESTRLPVPLLLLLPLPPFLLPPPNDSADWVFVQRLVAMLLSCRMRAWAMLFR